MHLGASPREDFRAAEIIAQNTTAVAAKPPRLLLAGVGLFLIYFLLKGKK